jgi:peptide/nickel transport system permease protein
VTAAIATVAASVTPPVRTGLAAFVRRHPTVAIGGTLPLAIVLASLAAPWLGTVDPISIDPSHRLRGPSADNWFGTDRFGRDLYSRVLRRPRLVVGCRSPRSRRSSASRSDSSATTCAPWTPCGMRVMDGMMAIPAIVLAIPLIALSKASITS